MKPFSPALCPEEISIPDELAKLGSCYLMAFPIKLKGLRRPARQVAAV